jgi:hypothetical protein
MEGQDTIDGAAHAPEKPKPESITPQGVRRLAKSPHSEEERNACLETK